MLKVAVNGVEECTPLNLVRSCTIDSHSHSHYLSPPLFLFCMMQYTLTASAARCGRVIDIVRLVQCREGDPSACRWDGRLSNFEQALVVHAFGVYPSQRDALTSTFLPLYFIFILSCCSSTEASPARTFLRSNPPSHSLLSFSFPWHSRIFILFPLGRKEGRRL